MHREKIERISNSFRDPALTERLSGCAPRILVSQVHSHVNACVGGFCGKQQLPRTVIVLEIDVVEEGGFDFIAHIDPSIQSALERCLGRLLNELQKTSFLVASRMCRL